MLVTATKKLEGRTLKAGEFSFVLVNNKDEKESYTAVNDAQGNVGFNLTFKDPGVYTYTIKEGMKWSNGDVVKASDFVNAWKRAASAELAADAEDGSHRWLA